MVDISQAPDGVFQTGPFPHFQRALGLFRPVGVRVITRAVVCVAIGWLPLVVLVIAQSGSNPSILYAFFTDFAVHARSLVAAPLFIISELLCLSALEKIARHFITTGLIEGDERLRFKAYADSTRRLINSRVAEVVCIVAVYVIVVGIMSYVPQDVFPEWSFIDGRLSWAGGWSMFVSAPLLLVLFFSWLWRILLWGRFLFRTSRLHLRLIAAHPDCAAGLRFLNSAIFAFMPFAFTLGIIAAGTVANRVAHERALLDRVEMTLLGLAVFVLLLVAGPLIVFVFNLHAQKLRGTFRYGLLAQNVGRDFEKKWLENYDKYGDDALEAPDFSATTDLYGIASNIQNMSHFPFEVKALIALIVVTLLPFVPVALMAIPFKVILKEAASLLF
ncbi:MAG TPA: hypothetical protein VFM63_03860 [Pyrinomonadaceae bacterium]|nr:hypothetical protein [Pyrinomonadaceae bacterium]